MDKATAYINGTIYTMEAEGSTCEAFVVKDGKFVYCGSSEQARAMADETVDLNGAPVVPGLIDTHQHLYFYAECLTKLALEDVRSLKELKEVLRAYAKDVPKGEWIYGFGFDNELFTDDIHMPTRQDLDEACPDHPVLLGRSCMHFFSANSLALKLAGIDRHFRPAVEGNVQYDADGEPTGVVCDAGSAPLTALIPDAMATMEARMNAVERAIRENNSHGLTGIHAIEGKHLKLMEYADVYQNLAKAGRLTARIYLGMNDLPNCSITTGLGDDMVKYGFYKLFIDGNFGGRTAAMLEPYADDPSTNGITNWTQGQLNAMFQEAYDRDIQIGVHVIGDRAADMLTTAIEHVYYPNPKPDPRFRMIHMNVVNEDIIARIKKLPVVLDIQPMFIHTDMPWMLVRMGEERCKNVNVFKRYMDEGLMVSGGSDAPGTPHDPFEGIYCAVTRKDMSGYPEGGWHPEQCVSVYDAMCWYTKNAAYASYEEEIKGTIEAGKLADFVVLDADVFKVPHDEIKDIKVEKTYLGGKEVYSRK